MIATGTALALSALAGAGATAYGAHKSASASTKASQASIDAANRAAELEAKSATDALTFAKEQEAARQREWQAAQDRNYQLYLEQQARLSPYRRLGAGSIAQLALPIPKTSTPVSGTTIQDLLRG